MQMFVTFWDKVNKTVVALEKGVLIVLFVSMLFSGALQIIARFILHTPISWSEEMLTYSFVWSSFLGASLAIESLAHFNVDLFISPLSAIFCQACSLSGLVDHALVHHVSFL